SIQNLELTTRNFGIIGCSLSNSNAARGGSWYVFVSCDIYWPAVPGSFACDSVACAALVWRPVSQHPHHPASPSRDRADPGADPQLAVVQGHDRFLADYRDGAAPSTQPADRWGGGSLTAKGIW